MIENKTSLAEIVEVHYQSPFKIFNINSFDGKTATKPFGLFVSLGLTTSTKVLESVRRVIEESGYSSSIVRIISKRIGSISQEGERESSIHNRYINCLDVIFPDVASVEQFNSTIPDNIKLFNESESRELLNSLRSKMSDLKTPLSDVAKLASQVSRVKTQIEKITVSDGWDTQSLAYDEKNNEYFSFHRTVNYLAEDEVEKRIGIYVVEN